MENITNLVQSLVSLPSETAWVEFKHNNDERETIGKNISAVANAAALNERSYGYIIWGVDDTTHEIIGTSFNLSKVKNGGQELENWLRCNLSKNADFEFAAENINGKWVVVLKILAASGTTVMFQKQEFIRIGSNTKNLNDFPLVKSDLWTKLHSVKYETLVAEIDFTSERVLDLLDYPTYYELLGMRIPESYDKIISDWVSDEIIKRQDNGLYSITNLGALLFAKNLNDFSSLSRKALRVAVYGGDDKLIIKKSDTISKGYALAFTSIEIFLDGSLPTTEIIDGAFRKEVVKFPRIAIREALANALIHQDLSISGTSPIISIFENHIEITNPGISLVDIHRIIDLPPKSRNVKMASLMRRMRLCEELGSGWYRIPKSCEDQMLPPPKMETLQDSTRVSIYSYVPFALFSKEDKLRACYYHACLMYKTRSIMNNTSLRKRFGIEEKNSAMVSRLLKEAVNEGCIRIADETTAPRYYHYLPSWA